MWAEYKRIIKDRGAIVLTASQPFTSKLVMSNKKMFRHEWIWKKNYSTGFLNVKRLPMRSHESILVFGKKSPHYYPVMRTGFKPYNRSVKGGRKTELYSRADKPTTSSSNGERYPITVIEADRDKQRLHPTQKPVALFEYLIKTYTKKGGLVLDNCAGSGTTGVACKNLNRDFILIEQEQKYCDKANQRLEEL